MSDGAGRLIDTECGAERTTVLLGAGASADAGLLLTSGLAAAVVEKANLAGYGPREPAKPDWVRALNAVYAGMVGYQGARGDNPLSAVNIETLISAVRLLRTRDAHEVAPFVATWAPALSNFGSSDLPTQSGKAILDAVAKALGSRPGSAERDITEAVGTIARAAVRPDLAKPFADAETFIMGSLVELLGAHQDVSYFEPLLELARTQAGGLDVITLNYDLTGETAAEKRGVKLNRGIESWHPGENLDFPGADGTLNLLKLHGSLDWRASQSEPGLRPELSPRGIDIVPPNAASDGGDWRRRQDELPWIVVGDREKLATDGPTLALNFAARSALLRATHLAVVGYSFGDAHINAMVRDWLAGNAARTMSVLDLRWPRERYFHDAKNFRSALIASYGQQQDHRGCRVLPRVRPIEGSTAERLGDVLRARPNFTPDPLVTVSVTRDDLAIRFDVTWHGVELADATLTAWPVSENRNTLGATFSLSLYQSKPIPVDPAHNYGRARTPLLARWEAGSTLTFYAAADTVLPIQLKVDGASIVGLQKWEGRVGVGPRDTLETSPDETRNDPALGE